jgi:hypothetical protein
VSESAAKLHNDLTMKFFESARLELVERVRLRDQTLIVYVGAVSAYFAFAAKEHFGAAGETGLAVRWDALDLLLTLPLPVVCLVSTLILLNHHELIAKLGAYIEGLTFKSEGGGPAESQPWNVWRKRYSDGHKWRDSRFWAQLFVLFLPLSYAVFVNFSIVTTPASDVWAPGPWLSLALDFAAAFFVVGLHIRVKLKRDEAGRVKPPEPPRA